MLQLQLRDTYITTSSLLICTWYDMALSQFG